MVENNPIQALSEQFTALQQENEQLREQMADVMLSIRHEDAGWELIAGVAAGERLEGLDLEEVKEISKTIRPRIVAGSLTKRGVDLHAAYVWGRGINIPGTEKPKRGAPSELRKFYVRNFETLFSTAAQQEMQKCRYADGNIFALCVPGEKVRFIPINEIHGVKVNPDFPSEVWAYLRRWTPNPKDPDKIRQAWYYTKRYAGVKQKSFSSGGETIPVGNGVIVDRGFNKQIGWPLGVPDATAALAYIQMYGEVLNDGRVVTRALAKLLYKVSSPNKRAAQNAAVKLANMPGVGNAASMTGDADVQAISTAGRSYDFQAAKPIAAMAAAALNLPNVELLADTSAAGSSYGAGNLLTSGTQNAMQILQREWIDFYTDIFEAYKISVPQMWFDAITEPDPYRKAQQLTLLSPTLTDEEYRGAALDQLNIEGIASNIPPALASRSKPQIQASSPDQGVSNGTGGQDSAQKSDQRSDLISEALNASRIDDLTELVERMEAAVQKFGEYSQ